MAYPEDYAVNIHQGLLFRDFVGARAYSAARFFSSLSEPWKHSFLENEILSLSLSMQMCNEVEAGKK